MSRDKLSGQDAAFLAFEGPGRPMHVGVLALLEMPQRRPGAFTAELRQTLLLRLERVARFRQRLVRGPRPRWEKAADADPSLHVHVLPTAERYGSPAFLDHLGRVFARPLDPERPLWEAWILPGLDGGRHTALLFKAHHAMVDGRSGVALLSGLLEPDGAPPPRRAHPPTPPTDRPAAAARGLLDLVRRLLRPTPRTALNGPASPRRELATLSFDEDVLRRAARRAGGTTNDALLAVVAEGTRRWLASRGERGDNLRAFCPVDVRGNGQSATLGNRLGAWLVDLPAGEGSVEQRIRAVRRSTGAARSRGQSRGVELLARLSDRLPAAFPRWGMALAGRLRAFNLVVTHVRGPEQPLRLAGARLLAVTALAPVFPNQRCSVAALRYRGRVHLGLTGAWPDEGECRRLAGAIEHAYRALDGAHGLARTA